MSAYVNSDRRRAAIAIGLAVAGLLILGAVARPLLWLALAGVAAYRVHGAVGGLTDDQRTAIGDALGNAAGPWRDLIAPWPAWARITAVGGAVVAPFLLFLLIVPALQATTPEMQDAYRRTWAQIFAGIFVLVGAYVAWRRVAAMENRVAVEAEGQITERFTRAIDQLGHKSTAIRLGGIYALERIARDSPRDHWTVMETLTAFIRVERERPLPPEEPEEDKAETAEGPGGATADAEVNADSAPVSEEADSREAIELPPTDVQAALTVIGRRRKPEWSEKEWREREPKGTVLDLSQTDLRGVNLHKAYLEGADLSEAHLERADLSEAHLERADLSEARLERADLSEARLERADLSEARLEWADLQRARLEGATLWRARLAGATLWRARLERANLGKARLEGAFLYGARLEGAHLSEANLAGADLRRTEGLTYEQLCEADWNVETQLPTELITEMEEMWTQAHWVVDIFTSARPAPAAGDEVISPVDIQPTLQPDAAQPADPDA